MAKWGEGDPRWLVEDRPDATNVNNWHWTEKNASEWSKNKLSELLVDLKIEDDSAFCIITEMNKCDGEAVVNNRKAKLIFFYEWTIELKWKGKMKDDNDSGYPAAGTIEVLNLSEEHNIEDVDVVVTLDSNKSDFDHIKEMMRKRGIELVKQKLSSYLKSLKEEFSKGLILPTKNSISTTNEAEAKSNKKINLAAPAYDHIPGKKEILETCELNTTENFKCTADEFYRALTTKEMIQAFTQSDCYVDANEGGKFEMYGKNVYGTFVELVPNLLIRQKWRFSSWPEGIYSDVTIKINQKSDSTEVNVYQKGIPKTEYERTDEGWKRYYWESMKRVFGFGSVLF